MFERFIKHPSEIIEYAVELGEKSELEQSILVREIKVWTGFKVIRLEVTTLRIQIEQSENCILGNPILEMREKKSWQSGRIRRKQKRMVTCKPLMKKKKSFDGERITIF